MSHSKQLSYNTATSSFTMRLINTRTLELVEFVGNMLPYAILSHTWEDEEVSFQDMQSQRPSAQAKRGYAKILALCKLVVKDGLRYA